MRTILIGITAALITSPALAQQDPDDPGIQDSVIVDTITHIDSTNFYQFINVLIIAVTDDSVGFIKIPITVYAPLGGVFRARRNLFFPPLTCWDCFADTFFGGPECCTDLCFGPLYPDTSVCVALYTDSVRASIIAIPIAIAPNTPSQLVTIDTCWDERQGSLLFGLSDGETSFTPAFQPGYFGIGSVGVSNDESAPKCYSLLQNYPNPFNSSTTISYTLPESGPVTLSVYNLLGQKVATLVEGVQQAGEHKAVWDAKGAPSGVYFYRLLGQWGSVCRRMLLVK